MPLPPFRPEMLPKTARLFPLPTVVFFPRTYLPLHIFEPRYRQLVKDAMAGDRLVAVVLLRPGHEAVYLKSAPVHDIAGLGRIVRYEPIPDGRSNIVLEGVARIGVGDVVSEQPYRTVRVRRVEEPPPSEDAASQVRLAAKLIGLYGEVLGAEEAERDHLHRLLVDPFGLGVMADLLAATTNLRPHQHQALLEEIEPVRRAKMLIRFLRDHRTLLRLLERRETGGEPPDPPATGPGHVRN